MQSRELPITSAQVVAPRMPACPPTRRCRQTFALQVLRQSEAGPFHSSGTKSVRTKCTPRASGNDVSAGQRAEDFCITTSDGRRYSERASDLHVCRLRGPFRCPEIGGIPQGFRRRSAPVRQDPSDEVELDLHRCPLNDLRESQALGFTTLLPQEVQSRPSGEPSDHRSYVGLANLLDERAQ